MAPPAPDSGGSATKKLKRMTQATVARQVAAQSAPPAVGGQGTEDCSESASPAVGGNSGVRGGTSDVSPVVGGKVTGGVDGSANVSVTPAAGTGVALGASGGASAANVGGDADTNGAPAKGAGSAPLPRWSDIEQRGTEHSSSMLPCEEYVAELEASVRGRLPGTGGIPAELLLELVEPLRIIADPNGLATFR